MAFNPLICGLCTQVGSEWECMACSLNICTQCMHIHLRTPNSVGHPIRPLYCRLHANLKADTYCKDCKVYVCRSCSDESHKNHDKAISAESQIISPVDIENIRRRYNMDGTQAITNQAVQTDPVQKNNYSLYLYWVVICSLLVLCFALVADKSMNKSIALPGSFLLNKQDSIDAMSVIGDKLWIPNPATNTIQIFALNGKYEHDIQLPIFIEFPRLIKSVSENDLILASETGLFLMGKNGMIMYSIVNGNFSNFIYVDESTILTFDHKSRQVMNCCYVDERWSIVNTEAVVLQPEEKVDKSNAKVNTSCSVADCQSKFHNQMIDYQVETVIISANMMDLGISNVLFVIFICGIQMCLLMVFIEKSENISKIEKVSKSKKGSESNKLDVCSSHLNKMTLIQLFLFLFTIVCVFWWNFHWFPLLVLTPLIICIFGFYSSKPSGMLNLIITAKDVEAMFPNEEHCAIAVTGALYQFVAMVSFLFTFVAIIMRSIYLCFI